MFKYMWNRKQSKMHMFATYFLAIDSDTSGYSANAWCFGRCLYGTARLCFPFVERFVQYE